LKIYDKRGFITQILEVHKVEMYQSVECSFCYYTSTKKCRHAVLQQCVRGALYRPHHLRLKFPKCSQNFKNLFLFKKKINFMCTCYRKNPEVPKNRTFRVLCFRENRRLSSTPRPMVRAQHY